jgi:RsmE family RNA methyltransferase
MKEIRTFYVPDALTANELPTDEAMHALRVLRMKIGDEMVLMDGQGNYYRAEVTLAHTKHCLYEIKEQMPQERQWKGHIHLAIAPTKMMDRIEWMTEKAVEVGLDELSFLNCQFSERRLVKIPRLEKIMISAVKQSHKAWATKLNDTVTFDTFIDAKGVIRGFRLTGSEENQEFFAAVGKEPRIDFVDMPAKLKGKYQYHTEAQMGKLRAAGCDVPFRPLEDAVKDYVETHLSRFA